MNHRRLPRLSVRLRLTALYGVLFLISGAGLLAITYLLATEAKVLAVQAGPPGRPALRPSKHRAPPGVVTAHGAPPHPQSVINLHELVLLSAAALAIMAVISIALGWLVAGRVLSRLRTITRTAREISATNLHDRLALDGPDDELKELGGTLDELLARLEASFEAQRQFVANASHELRTPLARQRTLLEIALADPRATVESLQANNQRLLAAGEQQERLIEALLTLARSERGLDHRDPLDLATIIREVLAAHTSETRRRDLQLVTALAAAPVSGERHLIERLISNLIDNAIRYNTPSGQLEVRTALTAGTGTSPDSATLTVANSGAKIPAGDVERLLRPFQRLDTDRRAQSDGTGLGLSIVAAIAAAHGATLTAHPQPHGGLSVTVRFPATAFRTAGQVTSPPPTVPSRTRDPAEPWSADARDAR